MNKNDFLDTLQALNNNQKPDTTINQSTQGISSSQRIDQSFGSQLSVYGLQQITESKDPNRNE